MRSLLFVFLTITICNLYIVSSLSAADTLTPYNSPYGICAHVTRGERHIAAEEFDLMRAAGIDLVRSDFDWKTLEPKQGEWQIDHWDSLVQLAKTKGVGILPILDYDVAWARPVHKNLDAWRGYVRMIVEHYKDDLPHWEVWNEQNHEIHWHDKADGVSYAKLLQATYETIKAVHPDLTVVYGGVAGIPFEFIENSLKAGAAKYFDVMAIHPYRLQEAPEVSYADDLSRLQALLAKYDAPQKIWVTEQGWTTNQTRDFFRDTLRAMLDTAIPATAEKNIAYINDPGFPFTSTNYSFSIDNVFPDANASRAIKLDQLVDLNPSDWPILIPTSDESFPMDYFDALESYVRRGGIIVLPHGVPFYYDLRRTTDGSLEKIMVDETYRQRLHLGWTAWWIDAKVPRATGRAEVAPEFTDRIRREENHAEIYLTDVNLKPGDHLQPVIYGITDEYKGAVAAIYHLDSDLKGKVVTIAYKGMVGNTTEAGQAEMLPRAMLISFAHGVEKYFWYELQAVESTPHDRESHFGILHKDLSPKPAYHAYATLTRMRPLGSSVPILENTASDIHTASWKRPDGKTIVAIWTPREKLSCVLKLDRPLEQSFNHLGQLIEIDPEHFEASGALVYLVGPEKVVVQF